MATADIDIGQVEQAMEVALTGGIQYLTNKIIEITPRDPARPPKNRNAKVTGNLKRSIGYEKVGDGEYRIGVRMGYGNTAVYGMFQEFGTVRLPPRSFLRKGLADNMGKVMEIVEKIFTQYLNRNG